MLHILVVDDEPFIANGVSQLLSERSGLEARVWKALSAKQAMEIFEQNRIDLLITDIQMPGMTGIELVNRVKQQWKRCKVIFLTGYSDYEYMHFALQQQVAEYMLKPIEDEQLLEKVLTVVKQIRDESNTVELARRAELQLQQAKPLLIHDLVEQILRKEPYALARLDEQFSSLRLQMTAKEPVLLLLGRVDYWPDGYIVRDRLLMEFAINNMIEEFLTSDIKMLTCTHERYLIWIFQSVSSEFVDQKLFIQISEIIDVLQQAIHDLLRLKISFIISPHVIGWDELSNSYEHMAAVLKKGIGMEQEIIIAHSEHAMDKSQTQLTAADLNQSIRKILTSLEAIDGEALQSEVAQFFGNYARSVFVDYGLQMEAFCTLSLAIIRYMNEKNIRSEVTEKLSLDLLVNYNQVENLEAWEKYCQELFRAIIEIVKQKGEDQKFEISEKVDAYIESHLHGDLSLTNLAKQVHLSSSYLSRMYFSERGYHLSDKITELKVVKAKQLLEEGTLKIYEIALSLGFDNIPYFSRFFKKRVGITPQEYKENNRI
ncbi:response regulator transcription factor [Paenibacillus sp. SYP-B4298]|uniref:response regulator transcription factor n=1 Tax=Paenibacillus sp. SYP-B4298 TaxID=2996034 RepID=UPI0022DE4E77|nr:response regulator [Paenibacillus sp. SYP-B4298]